MPYKTSAKKTSVKKTGAKKFSNDKFLMMQCGTQFLDDGDYGQKTRILFSTTNDEWSWCIREKATVTHWFGVEKGRELLFRAIEAGQALGTSAFFEKEDCLKGNPRINIKGVATAEELEEAKEAAEAEAWADFAEEEEEEEDVRPARKPAAKARSSKAPKRTYPALEEAADSDADDTYDEDVLPF
jgi:hypothetical protein